MYSNDDGKRVDIVWHQKSTTTLRKLIGKADHFGLARYDFKGKGVKRKFRLTSAKDFKRVRRSGKSYAHPLIVLISSPNLLNSSRFGISAGRSVGNAISRNKAKRQLREIIRPLIYSVAEGCDIIFLARKSVSKASYSDLETAVVQTLQKAKLLDNN